MAIIVICNAIFAPQPALAYSGIGNGLPAIAPAGNCTLEAGTPIIRDRDKKDPNKKIFVTVLFKLTGCPEYTFDNTIKGKFSFGIFVSNDPGASSNLPGFFDSILLPNVNPVTNFNYTPNPSIAYKFYDGYISNDYEILAKFTLDDPFNSTSIVGDGSSKIYINSYVEGYEKPPFDFKAYIMIRII